MHTSTKGGRACIEEAPDTVPARCIRRRRFAHRSRSACIPSGSLSGIGFGRLWKLAPLVSRMRLAQTQDAFRAVIPECAPRTEWRCFRMRGRRSRCARPDAPHREEHAVHTRNADHGRVPSERVDRVDRRVQSVNCPPPEHRAANRNRRGWLPRMGAWRWLHLPFAEPGAVLLGPAPGCADTGGNDNAIVRFRASPTLGKLMENPAVFRKAVRGRTTSAPGGRRFGLQRRGWAAPAVDCTSRTRSICRDSPCLTKMCLTSERIVLSLRPVAAAVSSALVPRASSPTHAILHPCEVEGCRSHDGIDVRSARRVDDRHERRDRASPGHGTPARPQGVHGARAAAGRGVLSRVRARRRASFLRCLTRTVG